MSSSKMEAQIVKMIREGHDPKRFVKSMVPFFKVSAEDYLATVERLVAANPLREVDSHTRAQMNLATERSFAAQNSSDYRAFNHEEA